MTLLNNLGVALLVTILVGVLPALFFDWWKRSAREQKVKELERAHALLTRKMQEEAERKQRWQAIASAETQEQTRQQP